MAYFYTTKKHFDELTGVVEVTSEHTLAEPNKYVVATSGTFDINLPDSPSPGDEFVIKNVGSGVVTVTGGQQPCGTIIFATSEIGGGGTVYVVAEASTGDFFIGGSKRYLGPLNDIDYLAKFDSSGVLDTTFKVAGLSTVQCIAPDSNGGCIISMNNSVKRITSSGSIDGTWTDPVPAGIVYKIIPVGNQYMLAGSFTSMGGNTSYASLCLVNNDGTIDSNFVPTGFPYSGPSVRASAAVQDGTGWIVHASSYPLEASKIVRLNGDGSEDTNFTHVATDFAADASIIKDGTKWVLGASLIGGTSTGITRLNSDFTEDVTFSMDAAGYQDAITGPHALNIFILADGSYVTRSSFFYVNNNYKAGLLRTFSDGSIDPKFENLNKLRYGSVRHIAPTASGDFVVGGNTGFPLLSVISGKIPDMSKVIDGAFYSYELHNKDYLHIKYVSDTVGWSIAGSSKRRVITGINGVQPTYNDEIVINDYASAYDYDEPGFYLPPAGQVGRTFTFKHMTSYSRSWVNVLPDGSDTIDGGSMLEADMYDAVRLFDTGSEWIVI